MHLLLTTTTDPWGGTGSQNIEHPCTREFFHMNAFVLLTKRVSGKPRCPAKDVMKRTIIMFVSVILFRGDSVMKLFYGHSPFSADSRRVVITYWRKNVHQVLIILVT